MPAAITVAYQPGSEHLVEKLKRIDAIVSPALPFDCYDTDTIPVFSRRASRSDANVRGVRIRVNIDSQMMSHSEADLKVRLSSMKALLRDAIGHVMPEGCLKLVLRTNSQKSLFELL